MQFVGKVNLCLGGLVNFLDLLLVTLLDLAFLRSRLREAALNVGDKLFQLLLNVVGKTPQCFLEIFTVLAKRRQGLLDVFEDAARNNAVYFRREFVGVSAELAHCRNPLAKHEFGRFQRGIFDALGARRNKLI